MGIDVVTVYQVVVLKIRGRKEVVSVLFLMCSGNDHVYSICILMIIFFPYKCSISRFLSKTKAHFGYTNKRTFCNRNLLGSYIYLWPPKQIFHCSLMCGMVCSMKVEITTKKVRISTKFVFAYMLQCGGMPHFKLQYIEGERARD